MADTPLLRLQISRKGVGRIAGSAVGRILHEIKCTHLLVCPNDRWAERIRGVNFEDLPNVGRLGDERMASSSQKMRKLFWRKCRRTVGSPP